MQKVDRVIKFNQKDWLKPYIDMNTKLRQEANNNFDKVLMNIPIFGKTMENARKYRDIKLVTTKRRRNYLVSAPNYGTTNFFTENLLVIEMKKNQTLMNKHVCLGLSILHLSKTVWILVWLCKTKIYGYYYTDSFFLHVKTELKQDLTLQILK